MAIHIGCGSWADDKYVGVLYPKGLPAAERLRVYTQWFDRIELNNTYYKTPSPKTVAEWAAQTPAGFVFDFKLHRSFSQNPSHAAGSGQMGKLVAAAGPLIRPRKLGAFLLTLPSSFGPDQHRLDEIDGVIDGFPGHLLAVELRHRGWLAEGALAKTLDFFRNRNLVWVATDLPQLDSPNLCPSIDEVTNPRLAYLRLHGRNPNYLKAKTTAEKHDYDYPENELEEIVGRIQALALRAQDVHVSANNHAGNFAPKTALALRRLLGQRVPGVKLDN